MNKFVVSAVFTALLTGACTIHTSHAVVTSAPISFAVLTANSKIDATFESQGCYYHSLHHLTFTNNLVPKVDVFGIQQIPPKILPTDVNASALVAEINRDGNMQWKHIGSVRLSSKQAARLDDMLALYRYFKLHPSGVTSTTHNKITFAFSRADKVVQRELYNDDTGLVDLPWQNVKSYLGDGKWSSIDKLFKNTLSLQQLIFDVKSKNAAPKDK